MPAKVEYNDGDTLYFSIHPQRDRHLAFREDHLGLPEPLFVEHRAASGSDLTALSISRSLRASTRAQSVLPCRRLLGVRFTIHFALTAVERSARSRFLIWYWSTSLRLQRIR
jgi:hypothetical protein